MCVGGGGGANSSIFSKTKKKDKLLCVRLHLVVWVLQRIAVGHSPGGRPPFPVIVKQQLNMAAFEMQCAQRDKLVTMKKN